MADGSALAGTDGTQSTVLPNLTDSLSEAELQALLSRLSDEQVREILLSEFARNRSADAEPGAGFLANAREMGEQLSINSNAIFSKWPEIGDAIAAVFDRLAAAGGLSQALLALIVSFAIGFAVRFVWRRRAVARQVALAERNIDKGSYGTLSTIGDATIFLLIDLSSVFAFTASAFAALYLFFDQPDIRIFASAYIAVATIVLIARSFIDLMFPQGWAIYRMVAISDKANRLLHWIVILLAGIWAFQANTADLLFRYGAPENTPTLISIMIGTVWLAVALVGFYLLKRETQDLLPAREDAGLGATLNRNWAGLTSAGIVVIWSFFIIGLLVSGEASTTAEANLQVLLLSIGFWALYRILVHYLRAQSIAEEIKAAITRAARAVLIAVGILIILSIYGLDPTTLATSGITGRGMQAAINVGLTALLGWSIWDFIRTLIDLRIEAEKPAEDTDEGADGEGGLGASRTATLLPLLRSFALAAIGLTCLFTAASSMGVNVAPLIAGAGVVGLAIGFGAQTLVKDVVSGIFFLIDDAFRRGEYIDLGTVKGTVERISVRSLQLRHHLGAVHTIPFGDIAALTNYSRDWVIMKLPLRLTFDTDPQKVKKIIKRIGAEFMENEDLGRGLLEPPKSQGVIQMEDSAMILRIKFKAIPGKQFTVRRELLHRIRAAFEEEGIRFANREVTVRVNEGASQAEKMEAASAAAARSLETPTPGTA